MGNLGWRVENEEKIALALTVQGELDDEMERLKEALPHFEAALRMRTELGDPLNEAYTRADMGRALYLMGYNLPDDAYLERAAAELKQAADAFEDASVPDSVVWASHYLGHALMEIASRGGGRFDEAIAAYERVLASRPRETHASEWAPIAHNIAYVRMLAAEPDGSAEDFEQAVAMARDAIAVYEHDGERFFVALGNTLICKGLTGLARARSDVATAREAVEACETAMPLVLEQGNASQREKAEETRQAALALLAELEARETQR